MRLRNLHSRKIVLTVLCCLMIALPVAPSRAGQESPIDLALAGRYFAEAEALCARDNSRLWGVRLCGPMIFADRQTRAAVANQSDREGRLTRSGNLFVGRLPESVGVANTALDWAGARWTMVMWPLPEDRFARAQLMAHELWHRVQEELRLPASNPANNHLDSRDGRLWLQLEWRALRAALAESGRARRRAIEDALVFRARRRQLFPAAAAAEERALEMNEGLAEYTGFKLSGRGAAEQTAYAVQRLGGAAERRTFVRSFAYDSGPAYGLLLDETGANWRARLSAQDDLGLLLQRRLSLSLPRDLRQRADERAASYDGAALRAAEDELERNRQARLAEYRARFVSGPVLAIPLTGNMRYTFDPNNLLPLDTLGTVYPQFRVSDDWGILTVTENGALMLADRTGLRLPAPADTQARPLQGAGWTLELNPGWQLERGARPGDYLLQKTVTAPAR